MSAATAPSLTQRQLAVMERIDRRMPIKVIAQELGVSETRINQHIRALKDFYGAESLTDLVENHRSTCQDVAAVAGDGTGPAIPLTNTLHAESQVAEEVTARAAGQADPTGPEVSPDIGEDSPNRSVSTIVIIALAVALIASFWVI